MKTLGEPVADRAEALAVAGRIADAVALLAADASGSALLTLAVWKLSGRYVCRDLPTARGLIARAAAAGETTAIAVHTCFLANGAGGRSDWPGALASLAARTDPAARRQHDLLDSMTLTADGHPTSVHIGEAICATPQILLFRSLLSPAECDYLIQTATPLLEPSMVIDPRSGRAIRDPVRTSDAAAFPFVSEDPVVHALNRRFAAVTGTRADAGEPLQVLRYQIGQRFHPHSDALRDANPRIWTVLTWLNTDYDGGGTHFLTPDLSIRGGCGDAVAFRSADDAGRPDPSARHAGKPVTRGVKLLASRWIRAQPLVRS